MARWIHLGTRKLNLDCIGGVRRADDGTVVVVLPGVSAQEAQFWTFAGAEAEQLWSVLAPPRGQPVLSLTPWEESAPAPMRSDERALIAGDLPL